MKNKSKKRSSPWNKGLTKETDIRIKKYSESLERRRKISLSQKGVLEKDWVKKQCSKIMLERWKEIEYKEKRMEKILSNEKFGNIKYSKFGYRKDLNKFFRSSWEANMARVFNYMNIVWVYEPKRFILSDGSIYIPDFYLPEYNKFVEVKGRFIKGEDNWWNKFSLFIKETYSMFEFPVFIESKIYKYFKEIFSKFISEWEN